MADHFINVQLLNDSNDPKDTEGYAKFIYSRSTQKHPHSQNLTHFRYKEVPKVFSQYANTGF